MQVMTQVAAILFLIALALLVLGLFKPWLLLWWKDVQTRRSVISIYGSLTALFLCIYLTFKYLL